MKKQMKKIMSLLIMSIMVVSLITGCGGSSEKPEQSQESETEGFSKDATVKEVLEAAAKEGKIGDWGNGEQYEIYALLNKYGLSSTLLSQGFDMSGFEDGTISVASAMSYNELGLIKNDYEGAYGYGDSVGVIDFNKEGISMVEDNLVCSKEFAQKNPNTVKAFIAGTIKGWKYAAENPEEAAKIVGEAGSTVSEEHQKYMAKEVAKLASTGIDGSKIENYCEMKDEALQQTLDITKKYVELDDSSAKAKLESMTLDSFRDVSYYKDALAGTFDKPEKAEVSIQLKWLAQSQFMGYYVAVSKGFYDEVGLKVTIIPGGGDISEITAVNSGQADFCSSWAIQTITAVAGGMDLIEVAQPVESAGMCMIYKIKE